MSESADEAAQLRARIAALESQVTSSNKIVDSPQRRVGFLLGIGIFLVPAVFVWFLLRRGHSALSRVLGFGWLALALVVWMAAINSSSGGLTPSTSASTADSPAAVAAEAQLPSSTALGVTAAGYSALKTSMTYEEASEILGSPGEELSSSDVAGTHTVMVMWKAEDGFSNMNAMFQNDHLVTKAQMGLR
jgi:hypothetical protein